MSELVSSYWEQKFYHNAIKDSHVSDPVAFRPLLPGVASGVWLFGISPVQPNPRALGDNLLDALRTRRLEMGEKKNEVKSSEIKDLEVEVLNDSDLESVAGGTNVADSNALNACCPAQLD